jgi:hypothetical protein
MGEGRWKQKKKRGEFRGSERKMEEGRGKMEAKEKKGENLGRAKERGKMGEGRWKREEERRQKR